jgi:hypothetical protein
MSFTASALYGALVLIQLASVYAIVVGVRTAGPARARGLAVRSAVLAGLCIVIGFGGTLLGTSAAYSAVDAGGPPQERAEALATAISTATSFTAFGMFGILLPMAAAVVCGIRAHRLGRSSATAPPVDGDEVAD